ncbi:hypothetical protein BJ986_002795 [Phycicoccus badiiscoriae]|uniref:HNH nuclease domain-containing protein n=1 Tax=Pedococcus badiiscoriae TaxID=642776 RepID=A0A852WH46_9MICO|nr:DUF222 domain-containing protein [Pedococcus badiiscoriae]NYG08308.1 hypothetical protein [Pedococcus badiiscoriae]
MSSSPLAAQRAEAQRALWARTATAAGRLNRAHAELVDVAVELIEGGLWGDGGFRSPEHYFTVRAGLSPAHARDVVVVARRRAELPETAAAVSAGELSLDAAAVVAHHVPASYQASMTHLARHATVPQLRRVVSRHAFHDAGALDAGALDAGAHDAAAEPLADPAESEAVGITPETRPATPPGSESERRACAVPELTMSYDRDGRFQLRYSAPATIGALVEQAVKEAKDALFLRQRGDDRRAADRTVSDAQPGASAVGGQERLHPTYADALAEMAQRSLAGVASTSSASHYRVYLHLDTAGAWVNNGGAIPQRLLARFLADGVLQPVWETQGRPVSVGRTMRILPPRSRRLIEDRDRGCRFPGCSVTRFVEVHHLREWATGGTTDVDNQVSLCPFHHDALDRGDFTITGDPTRPDGLVVVNRHGHRLRPPDPDELRRPDSESDIDAGLETTYVPPTGEPARWIDIEVPPDRVLTTFPPRVGDSADGPGRAMAEPAVVERDPFDAYRRWDETG